MSHEHREVLGLFPYFGPEAVGGVQASARIAWSAVTGFVDAPATLLSYAGNDSFDKAVTNPQSLIVSSKLEAIHKALSGSWSPDVVFVWHLGLLRLLPFFRFSRVRVVLMLLGIEAWKKHGWLTNQQMKKV